MRVLVVSYFFPPTQSVGVVRIAKFARYWAEAGVELLVLTSDDIHRREGRSDPALERDVAAVPLQVVETPLGPGLLRRVRTLGTAPKGKDSDRSAAPTAGVSARLLAMKVARRLRDHVLLPDIAIAWALPAYRAAVRAHAERPFDLVFASGNPWSNLVAACLIGRRLGLPVGIDFRDPWGDGPLYDYLPPWTAVERRAHRALEARVCRQAAVLTATTGPIADAVEARCAPGVKPTVVENGYDPADTVGIPRATDPSVFRVVMTSQFRAGDSFRLLLRALGRCLERGLPVGRRFVWSFAGMARVPGAARSLGDYFAEAGLAGTLDDRGFVTRREALALQRSADLCVFAEERFDSVNGGMVGTEFYEYLATGGRILLVDDESSAVWRVGAGAGTVRRCGRDDEAGMERALAEAMTGAWQPEPDWAWIQRFSRPGQAGRMLELFEAALAPGRREGAAAR